jgi:hypothetical protein
MYTLIKSIPAQQFALEQIPVIFVTFVVSEIFYKFHSFTLETLAFLATWYFFDLFTTVTLKFVSGYSSSKRR